MKVALCFSGYIGTLGGKTNKHIGEHSNTVLDLSYKHFKEHILDKNDVDIFIHSWEVDEEENIKKLYKPKLSIFENQIVFDTAPHIQTNDEKRKQAHYSRWYGLKKAVELKREYEIKNDFIYDYVMVSRFDIAWMNDVIFSKFDNKYFWIARAMGDKIPGKWYGWPYSGLEITDLWFFTNSENMDRFSLLYDNLFEYTKPKWPTWNGISSHFLSVFHLFQLGLLDDKTKFAFDYGSYGEKASVMDDFALIRCQYGEDLGVESDHIARGIQERNI